MTRFKDIVKNLSLLIKIAWKEDRLLLIGYFATSLISVFLLFLTYFLYKIMIDNVLVSLSPNGINVLFIIIITYLFFDYFSKFINSTLNSYYFEYILRSKFQNALTRLFMNKLASLDFASLEDGKTRNLIAKVADTYAWRIHDNLRFLNNIIYNLAAIIVSFTIASHYNFGYFFLLTILALPLYILRAKYGNTHWSIYTSQSKKINLLWYARYLFTEFNTLAEIKLYQLKKYFLKKIKKTQDEIIEEYKKPIINYTIFSSLSSLVFPFIIFFALKNMALNIIDKKYSVGDFTFFLNTIYTFIGQISSLLINFGTIYENNLYVSDYFKLQNITNTITPSPISIRLTTTVPRTIEFKNVFFSYPQSKKIALKNINLKINIGEDIAIVGHNGAGKTTLIKLLLRFYDPDKGKILVDNIDLRKINIDDWHQQLSVLFQDFSKYNFSLRDNIKFGNINKKTSDQEITDLIIKAQGQDILKIKKGLNQILGNWFENGADLSVGQWQKVAITRSLFRNAPFLILDEPTSNIDPQAEYDIFNNLKKIYKDKNIIFISHRFSTVRMADRIYVLNNGELVENGSHDELLANNNLYAKFFNIQKKGYE